MALPVLKLRVAEQAIRKADEIGPRDFARPRICMTRMACHPGTELELLLPRF